MNGDGSRERKRRVKKGRVTKRERFEQDWRWEESRIQERGVNMKVVGGPCGRGETSA